MPVVFDPNIVYLILVIGLWLGITAAYVPGTGVLEIISVGVVILSLYQLATVASNWWAVGLLILGVAAFAVMPMIKKRFTLLAVMGLLLQGIGAFFLFQSTPVSPLLIGMTLLIALAYHQLALRPALLRARERPVTDDNDTLIGARGRVLSTLAPVGSVYVNGEPWSATSERVLEVGDEVVVIEREGLRLIVEGAKHKNEEIGDTRESRRGA